MFSGLAQQDGRVVVPLGKTFWASLYGIVTDRFGVTWMVLVAQQQ